MTRLLIKLSIVCLLITLFYYGCKEKNSSLHEDSLVKMVFNVDSSQIEQIVKNINLNIRYAPPKKWKLVSGKDFEIIKKEIESSDSDSFSIKIIPVSFYAADSLHGILTVSSLEFSSVASYSEKLNEYSRLLLHKFKSYDIKNTTYAKDELNISQFLIQTKDKVIFKILFTLDNKVIQFDYISDRNSYPYMIKSIESSIGSIHLMHKSSNKGEAL